MPKRSNPPRSAAEPERWRPSAELALLQRRGQLLRQIRDFFARAEVLEVETPACSAWGNCDPQIAPFVTHWQPPGIPSGQPRWLHSSPEYPMKRLLAAGSGPIYQICKVYRNGERGRLHNPEFTLLEWYRPGYTAPALMAEVAALVNALHDTPLRWEQQHYGALFRHYLALDPLTATLQQLRHCARNAIPSASTLQLDQRDDWLDLLFSHCIQPHLGQQRLTFVYGYPASQAALAALDPDDRRIAQRFELFWNGVELANGFQELQDPEEQCDRFRQEQQQRAASNAPPVPSDPLLLAALRYGLPACSGVALGVDRLVMCLTGCDHIDQVIAFPWERA